MNPLDLPRPDDPELETMWLKEVSEHYRDAARRAVREYPNGAADCLAHFWVEQVMLDLLRGSIR